MARGLAVTLAMIGVAGFGLPALRSPASAQSLYQPGTVRGEKNLRAPLDPPEQPSEGDGWRVEPDITLHHFSEGRGRNVLVVHGGPGYPTGRPWAGLEPLTDDYAFHYYHQRGCGRSTRPVDTFSSSDYMQNMTELERALGLGAQVADIERIRRILGDERLILIGHSFGAFLAALYAAEFPDRVEAMVLVAPADVLVIPQEDGGLFNRVRQKLPEDMREEYGRFLGEYFNFGTIFARSEKDMAELNRRFVRFYTKAAGIDTSATGTGVVGIGGWVTHACFFSMGVQCDFRPVLEKIPVRTLVIHGTGELQSEDASRSYADLIPGAGLEVLAGGGHFPHETVPRAFGAAVAAFLQDARP